MVVAIVVCVFALALAAFAFWRRRTLLRELAAMELDTTPAAQIAAKSLGSLVEVKGTLVCDPALSSELGSRICAYYRAVVDEQVERWERDSQGRNQRRTYYQNVSTAMRHAPFWVEDASGRVRVDAQEATVEGVESVNRFEPAQASLLGAATSVLGGPTVRGRRYIETVLPIGVPVYVLGHVQADGSIGPAAPGTQERTFVVSTKSEEQRRADVAGTTKWLLWGGWAALAVALGAMVFALSR